MNVSILKLNFRAILTVLTCTPFVAGCGTSDLAATKNTTAERKGSDSNGSVNDPETIVARMIDRYRDASTFASEGEVTVTYDDGAKHREPISIKLVRPNRLSLSMSGVQVQSDGNMFSARILDRDGNNLLGQVLTTTSPSELTKNNVFGDPVLADFVTRRTAATQRLQFSPLFLLLDAQGFPDQLKSMAESSNLTEAAIDDKPCFGIANESTVMWVDKNDYLLRRIEMDSAGAKLVADFHKPRINEDIPAQEFQPLDVYEATPVGFFVVPPRQIPDHLLGKRPDRFDFVDLDGNSVAQEQMQGSINVLLWCINDENSRQALRAISEIRSRFKQDDVRFDAVWLDAQISEPQTVREQFERWNVDVPALRDPKLFSKDVFHVNHAPTLLVLDKQGVAQYGEIGLNPDLLTTLPEIIEQVGSGADVAQSQLRNHEHAVAKFEQDFAEAQAASTSQVIEIPKVQVKQRTDPQQLVLTKLWECDDITAPGNILAVNDAQPPLILALDGFRSVVQIDADGKVVKRHELELPDQEAVTYLRTATDDNGRRYFAAGQVLGQRVHVFDEDWKRLTSYPDKGESNAGIWDVQMFNLDEAGELPELYLGILDRPIVIQASLDGKSSKVHRIFQRLKSFDLSQRGELLIVTSEGYVLRFENLEKQSSQTPSLGIHGLYAGKFAPTEHANLCGLAYQDNVTMVAVGLRENRSDQPDNWSLQPQWTYELPAETFDNQMQFVTSGQLLANSGGQWIFARPDSSIHIVSDDGKLRDSFYYGKPLSGIAVADLGLKRALLIASDNEVTAWSLEWQNAPASPRD